ncbi:MAG TPA: hypothetical protein VFP90_06970 [Gemmatimonadaceae bacterium]|jgi:hypothetical protein|nr:hypothetical protein [Gemmatimonadaceae bacterium]
MRRLIVPALILVIPSLLGAQGSRGTISPGMPRARVVATLGTPATERTVGEFAYLFYVNECGRRCGMNDLVVLRHDSVVDAIFRSPARHYTGTSSSPAPIPAKEAAERGATHPTKPRPDATPARRPSPSAKPNDATPSIPVNPPALAPAPSSKPVTRSP